MQAQLQMTDGRLIGGGDVVALGDDSASLAHDVHCILMECHRDRGLSVLLRDEVAPDALAALAANLARRLGPRIGGRYVPKRDFRAERDLALIKRWDEGATRPELMKEFNVSRRWTYVLTTAELKRRRSAA